MAAFPGGFSSTSDQMSNGDSCFNSATDPSPVMAEQSIHDVVNQSRSVGDHSPSDVPTSTPELRAAGGAADDITKETSNVERADGQTHESSASRKDGGEQKPQNELDIDGIGTEPNVNSEASGLGSLAAQNALGEGSGGSDTDTSRTDGKAVTDGRHHSRTNSVKKPTPFKPVTFAKFSVAKAPGAVLGAKVSGDKASLASANPSGSSPQQTSRPRLVAKSTSGLRDSTPKFSAAGANKGSGGAPDPAQVWNKNRAYQPPSTKHLTDEELKQQYGIHMTSRLQDDGEGKEAKWADIDDDEDDWAPETIEWNDGTKITLTHTEIPPSAEPPVDDVISPPPSTSEPPREQPKAPVYKPVTSVGPNATVLKLGANVERQQAKAGLSSKGPGDKLTLSIKSAAPVPVKSPWAALPPVEKASPIAINPQSQMPPRQLQRDGMMDHTSMPVHSPAKEIAADDFNRSWRDNHQSHPRELYNSQSGRYEPVTENRRGSQKTDQHFRAPSLLQRSSHNDPALQPEPSASFQSHRSSQEGGPWNRRRTSSNVSGGSGMFARRMSIDRHGDGVPNDYLQQRRGSSSNNAVEYGYRQKNAPRGSSPGQRTYQAARPPRPSPGMAYAHPAAQTTSSASSQQPSPSITDAVIAEVTPVEDAVALQQRVMREKIELARKRRVEQEEKEEAEKRERIRIKLEQMDAQKPHEPAPKTPSATNAVVVAASSPPKPPVPEVAGEPQQYGLMKVHPPATIKKHMPANERSLDRSYDNNYSHRRGNSPSGDARSENMKAPTGPAVNGIRHLNEQSRPAESARESSVNERHSQNWKNPAAAAHSYSTWNGPRMASHSSPTGNLWGPLSNDKALGNGTFDRVVGGFGQTGRGHVTQNGQLPIGTPIEKLTSDQPLHPVSDNTTSTNLHPSEKLPTHPDSIKPIARPGPIGPPSSHSRAQNTPQPSMMPPPSENSASDRASKIASWNNFHNVAVKEQEEARARRAEADKAPKPIPTRAPIIETWRQIEPSDDYRIRRVVKTEKTIVSDQTPAVTGFGAVGDLLSAEKLTNPIPSNAGRGSRFFPHITEMVASKPAVDGIARPVSPSPPPPEEYGVHPAFTGGDSRRPYVCIPIPKPVVRLPPSAIASTPTPTTFASMAASSGPKSALRVGAQPIAATISWQDRFNGLLGKSSSPERKHVLAVASATKEPLEVMPPRETAAVSLPAHDTFDLYQEAPDYVEEFASRRVEELDDIFEDREAGSLPIVKIPAFAPAAAWNPATAPTQSRSQRATAPQSTSIEPYTMNLYDKENSRPSGFAVHVRLPGADKTVTKIMPRKHPGYVYAKRGNTNHRNNKKHSKSREASGSHVSSTTTRGPLTTGSGNTGASRTSLNNGGWPQRASGMAH